MEQLEFTVQDSEFNPFPRHVGENVRHCAADHAALRVALPNQPQPVAAPASLEGEGGGRLLHP